MKHNRWILTVCMGTLLLGSTVMAQAESSEVTVIPPEIPELRWGEQTITFDVTNHTDYLRFIVLQQTLTIRGNYSNTQRVLTDNHMLWPGESREIDVTIEIPGIFGTGTALIALYDVVDTLDAIYPGYDIYTNNLRFEFPIPDGLLDQAEADPELPPRVGEGMDFGYDFARLLVMLLDDGRSVSEIASLANCSESYVTRTIDSMVSRSFLKQSSAGPQVAIPYITAEHAQRASATIDSLAEALAATIAGNLQSYPQLLDSLVAAEALATDSNDFLDPGTVIYQRYAMTVPFLLWYDLGQEFISNPEMLFIFGENDPCNAWIPNYTYLVEQGDRYNGDHYFFMIVRQYRPLKIIFADHTPRISCPEEYWKYNPPLLERSGWQYYTEDLPENFVIDTGRVHLALRRLRDGTAPVLTAARTDAGSRGKEVGADRNPYGYRYWYWNLLATRTTEKLIDRGLISRPGNGNLRFEEFQ